MRLKNERPRLSKTVDDVVATIRMTLRNHANKFDEFWRIWRSIHQWAAAFFDWHKGMKAADSCMID